MPFVGELTLDFCEAETKAATREDVERAARTSPRDPHDWYMTLNRSDDEWMDATMDDDTRFGVRCSESGKLLEVSGIDAERLEALFVSYYEGDGAWKTLCAWKEKPPKRKFRLRDLFS